MTEKIPVTLRNMKGSILIFEDAAFMTRACGRLTQVMVFQGNSFTLHEAVGDRQVHGATILKDDMQEFVRIFNETEHSAEERSMIEEIGGQDFVIAMKREEEHTALYMHELSHVLFYYDKKYREKVTAMWNRLDESLRAEMISCLKESDYEDMEIVDEWFAHLFYGAHLFGFEVSEMPEEVVQFYNETVGEFIAILN